MRKYYLATVVIVLSCLGYLALMRGQIENPNLPSITSPNNSITVGGAWPNFTLADPNAPMSGASASIGGSLLILGGCNTADVTITGATTGMVAVASPVTPLANGIQWQAAVVSANTVRVYECALASITPASSVFQVRVIP